MRHSHFWLLMLAILLVLIPTFSGCTCQSTPTIVGGGPNSEGDRPDPGGNPCLWCGGDGKVNCTWCGGDGHSYSFFQGKELTCEHCNGKGYLICGFCGGTGRG